MNASVTADAFASSIATSWQRIFAGEHVLQSGTDLQITCGNTLGEHEDGMLLLPVSGPARALLRPSLAARLQLDASSRCTLPQLRQRMADIGIRTHGADRVFHFPEATLLALAEQPSADNIRPLDSTDADAFSRFQAHASEEDLDAAWVELDHWRVFGAFEGGRLVAAGSMYPWRLDPAVADTGVLTLADARGRGHACRLVQAMAVAALSAGLQPQYRCQLDNTVSLLTAERAGMRAFADWDTLLAAD